MITDRETDLRNDAAKGLDLSPGNEVSAWAVEEIDRLREENENLLVCVEYWKDQWHRQTARLDVELEKDQGEKEALRHALNRWLAWMDGPEGPDILFSEGTKALKATRAVLEDNP